MVETKIVQGKISLKPKSEAQADYWKHFDAVVDERQNELAFVHCRHCKTVLKRAKNTGSTAFYTHANACLKQRSTSKKADRFRSRQGNKTLNTHLLYVFACHFDFHQLLKVSAASKQKASKAAAIM